MELGLIPPAWTSSRDLPHSAPLQTLTASHKSATAGAQVLVRHPKNEHGKARTMLEAFQTEWWKGPDDTEICFVLQGTKPSLCLVFQSVFKELI